MARRLALLVSISLVAAGCGQDQPTASGTDASIPTSGSATQTGSSQASQPARGYQPPACVEAVLAYDASLRAMLLLNCVDQLAGQPAEQIWAWDGESWQLLDAGGPAPTVVAGVAFDSDRGVAVRYGGLPLDNNECRRETWEWDRANWTQIDVTPPTACDHMFLTYDAVRGRTLLFGGGDDAGILVAETWTWDGETWERVASDGPAGRAHFGLVSDAAHEQMLLYGGYDGARVFDDFWSWDGSQWEELDSPGAGGRSHLGLALGPEGLLLYGGAKTASSFSSLTDETWYLTGGEWSVQEGPAPSARGGPSLGYDPGRDVFVLYGGFDGDGTPLADTWEWDGAWRCVGGCETP